MKKKILFLEPFTGTCAGAQKVSLNVVKCLSTDFDLSLIKRNANSAYDEQLVDYKVDGYFPSEKHLKNIYGTGDFLKHLTLFKCLTVIFTIIICNIYTVFKVLKIKPSYIYTYDPRGLLLGGLFLRLLGHKVIWHLHSELPKNKLIKWLMLVLCTEIIVPSKAIADSLGKATKVRVIYNGFDLPKPLYEKPKSIQKRLLFLGTPHPHKGVHNLLEAIAILQNKLEGEDIILNVFGQFEKATADYKNVIDMRLQKIKSIKVEFRGWTTNAEQEIFSSDLLIFPSVIEQKLELSGEIKTIKSSEALPTVIIESLAMGVPVVATNTPGVSEIITNSNDGIIIKESEPEEIAKAIKLILSKINEFQPDRNYVISKFSLEAMNNELAHIFKYTK
ncbi:glycosyltransferase family 4 protein [Pseudoalteromonas nigrifaciens]|uniref:glycosyltransferase family 4 protein n=1 Tax=Pseudoalteromonas nigrifaciens TaxID=28109 RepID=UPI003FD2ACDC